MSATVDALLADLGAALADLSAAELDTVVRTYVVPGDGASARLGALYVALGMTAAQVRREREATLRALGRDAASGRVAGAWGVPPPPSV